MVHRSDQRTGRSRTRWFALPKRQVNRLGRSLNRPNQLSGDPLGARTTRTKAIFVKRCSDPSGTNVLVSSRADSGGPRTEGHMRQPLTDGDRKGGGAGKNGSVMFRSGGR